MEQSTFVLWFIQMVALYLVIKWAIDNSKAAEELKDLKNKFEEHIKEEQIRYEGVKKTEAIGETNK